MKFSSFDHGEDGTFNGTDFVETSRISAMQDTLCFGIGPFYSVCDVIFFCDANPTVQCWVIIEVKPKREQPSMNYLGMKALSIRCEAQPCQIKRKL